MELSKLGKKIPVKANGKTLEPTEEGMKQIWKALIELPSTQIDIKDIGIEKIKRETEIVKKNIGKIVNDKEILQVLKLSDGQDTKKLEEVSIQTIDESLKRLEEKKSLGEILLAWAVLGAFITKATQLGILNEAMLTSEEPSWDEINKKVDRLMAIKLDKELEPDKMFVSRGVKKIEEQDTPDGKLAIWEKDAGFWKTWIWAILSRGQSLMFSPKTFELYKLINAYAYVERTLNPTIPKRDLIKRLGGKQNRDLYSNLERYIDFLNLASYKVVDKVRKVKEWGHLINYAKEENVGGKSTFYFELNPHYHRYLEAVINNEAEIPPYTPYPLKSKNDGKINQLLLKLKSCKRTYPYRVDTLLGILGYSKETIEKRSIQDLASELDNSLVDIHIEDSWGWELTTSTIEKILKMNKWVNLDEFKRHWFVGLVCESQRAEAWAKENGREDEIEKLTLKKFLGFKIKFFKK